KLFCGFSGCPPIFFIGFPPYPTKSVLRDFAASCWILVIFQRSKYSSFPKAVQNPRVEKAGVKRRGFYWERSCREKRKLSPLIYFVPAFLLGPSWNETGLSALPERS